MHDNSKEIDQLRARFLRLKGLLRNLKYSEEEKEKIQKELDEVDYQILNLMKQSKNT